MSAVMHPRPTDTTSGFLKMLLYWGSQSLPKFYKMLPTVIAHTVLLHDLSPQPLQHHRTAFSSFIYSFIPFECSYSAHVISDYQSFFYRVRLLVVFIGSDNQSFFRGKRLISILGSAKNGILNRKCVAGEQISMSTRAKKICFCSMLTNNFYPPPY
jgi:hypothetical protein